MNQDNLAYLTALFPESEIVREQLKERRTRLKSFATCSNDTLTSDEDNQQYHSLLSIHVIPTQKLQILFLLTLVGACTCVCEYSVTYVHVAPNFRGKNNVVVNLTELVISKNSYCVLEDITCKGIVFSVIL